MKQRLPQVRKKRPLWAVVAAVAALAFFLIWTLGNFGTPGIPQVNPTVPPTNAPELLVDPFAPQR
jgi:hypothetical protein